MPPFNGETDHSNLVLKASINPHPNAMKYGKVTKKIVSPKFIVNSSPTLIINKVMLAKIISLIPFLNRPVNIWPKPG